MRSKAARIRCCRLVLQQIPNEDGQHHSVSALMKGAVARGGPSRQAARSNEAGTSSHRSASDPLSVQQKGRHQPSRRLVDRNLHPEPRTPRIQQFPQNGPVGVLKPYCTSVRTRRSLHKDAPASGPVQRSGVLSSRAILGGLHHHYARV